MAAECNITEGDVQKFIEDMGGRVTDHQLVKHFKDYLNLPEHQGEARAHFKKIVNAVATKIYEDGVKYLIVKRTKEPNGIEVCTSAVNPDNGSDMQPTRVPRVPRPGTWSTDLPPGHTPKPPPRRKSFAKNAKLEESRRQLNMEKKEQESSLKEDEVVSPGSVKEKAQKLNEMASKTVAPPVNENSNGGPKRREPRTDKGDDDAFSPNLGALKKRWIVTASKADYHGLICLLKDDPNLAHFKDFNKYTALHWAAKHGNLDVIKLLAGTHKVDPNLRSCSGLTPLHLAAMFDKEEIMEILINSYGADPTLRDYSGKRPYQYLPKNQAQRFISLFPVLAFESLGRSQGKPEKDTSFVRIGSLNSKMKKNSVVLAGGKALTRMKSWGSADNIQERDSNLMPPPRFFPKKRKSRKNIEYFEVMENIKGRSADSDSDSTSGTTS